MKNLVFCICILISSFGFGQGNIPLLPGKIEITNLSGQLLLEKKVNFQSEIPMEEVENLSPGIYFLSIKSQKGLAGATKSKIANRRLTIYLN